MGAGSHVGHPAPTCTCRHFKAVRIDLVIVVVSKVGPIELGAGHRRLSPNTISIFIPLSSGYTFFVILPLLVAFRLSVWHSVTSGNSMNSGVFFSSKNALKS